MSDTVVQPLNLETEAGRLQSDLRDVFRKMLSHVRRIDISMSVGDDAEALGQLRELEAYLERGLAVISTPLELVS